MRRRWNRATALLAFLLFASACGGTSYSLTLTEEQREAVKIDGWNQTGRTDLDADDWFEIVSTTCANQPHTEVTRSSVVAEWELDRLVPTDDAVFSLWLIAIQVCRDQYPEDYELPEGHPLREG
jgi:transcription termination factor NusB